MLGKFIYLVPKLGGLVIGYTTYSKVIEGDVEVCESVGQWCEVW